MLRCVLFYAVFVWADFATLLIAQTGPNARDKAATQADMSYWTAALRVRHERKNAAFALRAMGPSAKDAVPALIVALSDADAGVRKAVEDALGAIGPPGVAALIPLLHDPHISVRALASEAFGEIGSANALRALILALKDADENMRRAVAEELGDLADNLDTASDTSAIPALESALGSLESLSPSDFEATVKVNRALVSLRAKRKAAWLKLLFGWTANKWVTTGTLLLLLYLLWFALLRLFILRRWPLRVLALNEALLPYTDFKLPNWLGEVKIPVRLFPLLIGFFHYHRIILDAWVESYIEAARDSFQKRDTYRARQTYVPLPVKLDRQPEPVLNLTPSELQPITGRERWVIRLLGDGGVGKTTLACQLALWAMEADDAKRLCRDRRMVPVLIEPDIKFDVRKDTTAFRRAVCGYLQDSIGAADRIPDKFFEQLLRTRRIVVILDGLSEMPLSPESPRDEAAAPTNPDFPAGALIATSRTAELFAEAVHTDIEPLLIDTNHLLPFMNAYLSKEDLKLDDSQMYDACRRLAEMAGTERGITPLLAKLYVEELVGTLRSGKNIHELPRTIPDLMVNYLNYLNRGRQGGDPDNLAVQSVAKLVAWECMKRTFRPGQHAKKKQLISLLSEQSLDASVLSYLEKRLRLIRTVAPEEADVTFELDPLEEYLAALRALELGGSSEDEWRKFLQMADEKPGAPEQIKGFLLALHDCCEAKGSEYNVPNFVFDEVSRRAGLDPKQMDEIRLRQRVKRLIAGLQVPEAADRLRAAEALGEIGPGAEDAVPALISVLSDPDWKLRLAATDALGRMGVAAKDAVPALSLALQDGEAIVRLDAAEALGRIGLAANDAVPALGSALQDSDAMVRGNAAHALGRIGAGAKEAVPQLIAALRNRADLSLRQSAAEALGKIGPAAEAAVPDLSAALRSGTLEMRINAAEALVRIGSAAKEAIPVLIATLRDPDLSLSRLAAEGLGRMGPAASEAIPALVLALQDVDPKLCTAAAEALEQIKGNASGRLPEGREIE